MSENDDRDAKYKKRNRITKFHLVGLAKRLRIEINDLPKLLSREVSPLLKINGGRYESEALPSRAVAEKFSIEAINKAERELAPHTINVKPQQLIIDLVNAEMAASRDPKQAASLEEPAVARKFLDMATSTKQIADPPPGWIPDIDYWFFGEPFGDAVWRPHVPDFVLWDEVVKNDVQQRANATLAGLYFLYRPNGMTPSNPELRKAQRELLLIYPARQGHIRIHLIDHAGAVSSGLGYLNGDKLTVTLYRISDNNNIKSRTIMIDSRATRMKTPIKAVIARSSSSNMTPIASGAVLICIEQAEDGKVTPLIDKISALMIDARLRNDKIISSEEFEACEQLSKLAPKPDVPWSSIPDIDDNHLKFLKQKIFRLDEN